VYTPSCSASLLAVHGLSWRKLVGRMVLQAIPPCVDPVRFRGRPHFVAFLFCRAGCSSSCPALGGNILALGKNSLCMTAKGHARKLLVENFIQLPTSSVLKERVLVISGSPSDGFFCARRGASRANGLPNGALWDKEDFFLAHVFCAVPWHTLKK